MTDNEYFGDEFSNDVLLRDAKIRFEEQRSSLEGRNALVDGASEKIVVQNHTNPLNQARYDKKLSFDISSNVHTGSAVRFDDIDWLVISKIFDKQAYKVGSVLEITDYITINQNGILSQIPCVIESGIRLFQLGDRDNKYFSEPTTVTVARVPKNDITLQIKRNDKYKIGINTYEIIDVNDIIEPGLLILKMEFSVEQQNIPNYTLEVLNGDILELAMTQTIQLKIQIYKDDTIIQHNPSDVVYSTSNNKICEVSVDGVLQPIDEGEVAITVKYGIVEKQINVVISDVEIDSFTYEIIGEDSIIKNYTKQYTANKYNNGTLIGNAEFTFSVINDTTPSTMYTLTTIDDTNCAVKANGNTYEIILRATDKDNALAYVDKKILLKSILGG